MDGFIRVGRLNIGMKDTPVGQLTCFINLSLHLHLRQLQQLPLVHRRAKKKNVRIMNITSSYQ